jgi:hypothetical protein
MLQPGSHPDLAKESLGAERFTEMGVHHLQGYRTIVLQVVSQVDPCHPAAPELALKQIAVLQGLGQGWVDSGHEDAG